MRILIVDDDELALEMIESELHSIGYSDTTSALGSNEAVKILSDNNCAFDCFLIDIAMPGVDGIELVRLLREEYRFNDTPILMITASSSDRNITAAFVAGATDYITKPVAQTELAIRLKIALETSESRKLARRHEGKIDPSTKLVVQKGFSDFSYPYPINADSFIAFGAFQNYLAKISELDTFRASAVSIRIDNFSHTFFHLDRVNIRRTIEKIALIISNLFLDGRRIFCYVGHGLFFLILSGPKNKFSPALLEKAQNQIDLTFPNYSRRIILSYGAVRGIGFLHGESPLEIFQKEILAVEAETKRILSAVISGSDGCTANNYLFEERKITESASNTSDRSSRRKEFAMFLSRNLKEFERIHSRLREDQASKDDLQTISSCAQKISAAAPAFDFWRLSASANRLENLSNLALREDIEAKDLATLVDTLETFLDYIEDVVIETI